MWAWDIYYVCDDIQFGMQSTLIFQLLFIYFILTFWSVGKFGYKSDKFGYKSWRFYRGCWYFRQRETEVKIIVTNLLNLKYTDLFKWKN
jgi:hypothetical protein